MDEIKITICIIGCQVCDMQSHSVQLSMLHVPLLVESVAFHCHLALWILGLKAIAHQTCFLCAINLHIIFFEPLSSDCKLSHQQRNFAEWYRFGDMAFIFSDQGQFFEVSLVHIWPIKTDQSDQSKLLHVVYNVTFKTFNMADHLIVSQFCMIGKGKGKELQDVWRWFLKI